MAHASSIQDLRDQIDFTLARQPQAAPLGATADVVSPAAVEADFCALWPNAKPVLQAIAGIIGVVPAVGVGAAPVLTALITVGDQIFNSTCNKSR